MNNFWKDVRHGARLLARNPGLTTVAVLALTLGIGLTATMFSIVYGALFRGLAFEDANQIVHIEKAIYRKARTVPARQAAACRRRQVDRPLAHHRRCRARCNRG